MEGVVVPVAFFLALFAILYVYYTTRTKERLALVEKGMDANIFKIDPAQSRLSLVKWGIFLIGLSVGVITGYILSRSINEVIAFFTTILLFGGVALIAAYFITEKMGKKRS
jgi:energy-converting hydrogenase Eha subunit G